jgi:cytochrome d ubiquinol oxidase subunit II
VSGTACLRASCRWPHARPRFRRTDRSALLGARSAAARRAGAPDLERYFTVRAFAAALVAGAFAIAGIAVLHTDAPQLYDGLTSDGLPLVIISGLCGLAVLELLRRGATRGLRPPAVGALVAVIWGWGVAQYPYLLPESLTIAQGAAPSATLTSVLIVFGVAVVLVLPALALLFTLAQRSVIEESEGPQPYKNVPLAGPPG